MQHGHEGHTVCVWWGNTGGNEFDRAKRSVISPEGDGGGDVRSRG